MEAWYLRGDAESPRQPRGEPCSTSALGAIGLQHWRLVPFGWNYPREDQNYEPHHDEEWDQTLHHICKRFDVKHKSIVELYESEEEHLHAEADIRYILAGSGYFDTYDIAGRKVRIRCGLGDVVCLAAGTYHRFALDESGFCRAMRLFPAGGADGQRPGRASGADGQPPGETVIQPAGEAGT